MAWSDYASAPPSGTLVASEASVTGAHGVTVESPKGSFPLLLVRCADGVRAFVNACPHQYLPLDYRGKQLISADGTALICTAHGARFDRQTGEVLSGADCGLDPVPLQRVDGVLRIA